MHILKFPITERKEISDGIMQIDFGLDSNQFSFLPGQYIRLTIPELNYPDQRGNYRDFSIASSPTNQKTIQIAMRKSESGFKRTLFGLPVGTKVQVTGPHGNFTPPHQRFESSNRLCRRRYWYHAILKSYSVFFGKKD